MVLVKFNDPDGDPIWVNPAQVQYVFEPRDSTPEKPLMRVVLMGPSDCFIDVQGGEFAVAMAISDAMCKILR